MHNFLSLLNITARFGQSFRPLSGVQDCTYSIRYMSYRFVDCLLVGPLASIQQTCMLYVWSCAPDDGRKDCPKHVEWYSVNSKNCASSWFYYRNTGCNRRNGPDFGRVFLRSNYTDIIQNTYIQSSVVTEILAREVWNIDSYYSLIDYQIHIETGRNMWFL